jgi:hypothetical protein
MVISVLVRTLDLNTKRQDGFRQMGFASLGPTYALLKSPKLYVIDPMFVTTLTRQPSPDAALAGPMGALLEG